MSSSSKRRRTASPKVVPLVVEEEIIEETTGGTSPLDDELTARGFAIISKVFVDDRLKYVKAAAPTGGIVYITVDGGAFVSAIDGFRAEYVPSSPSVTMGDLLRDCLYDIDPNETALLEHDKCLCELRRDEDGHPSFNVFSRRGLTKKERANRLAIDGEIVLYPILSLHEVLHDETLCERLPGIINRYRRRVYGLYDKILDGYDRAVDCAVERHLTEVQRLRDSKERLRDVLINAAMGLDESMRVLDQVHRSFIEVPPCDRCSHHDYKDMIINYDVRTRMQRELGVFYTTVLHHAEQIESLDTAGDVRRLNEDVTKLAADVESAFCPDHLFSLRTH